MEVYFSLLARPGYFKYLSLGKSYAEKTRDV